ncbi:PAS/PAC sensor hybrid histidine kinase [Desulfatibacillum aliphaticivorans]|uniref:histidine kinase n=1 Tax=Desulfatibacillum aliphaticivorans TaxID=218208 RepID=B8FJD3_DESAL|nr:response regulator [Desulfatibacillum aliphaticivorans]ACL05602.1 PAS/PAC sensor hybrid histidine kinase [Desulfatibacillum aliphaticivorans]
MEGGPPKILTIDDEDAIRWSFASFLEDNGYEVVEAANGRLGVELFRREKPDLVLVDLRMPEMDGLEVLSILSKESPDVPLIVVSGAGVARDAVNALKMGAWDYIFKPIESLSILLHTVRKNLERAQLRKENKDYQENLEALVQERSEKLMEYSKRLKHITDCTLFFTACSTEDELCTMLLSALMENAAAGQGRFFLRGDDELVLKCSTDAKRRGWSIPLPDAQDALLDKLWDAGEAVIINAYEQGIGYLDAALQGCEGASLLLTPIYTPDKSILGLSILSKAPDDPFSDTDLELTALIATHGVEALKDINAARALTASEERFRALTENSSDITLIIGPDNTYTYASPSVFSTYGYKPGMVIGQYTSRNMHPKDVSMVEKALEKALTNPGQPIKLEGVRFRHRDGGWYWLEGVLNSQMDVPGVGGVVFSGRDVTERKASEQKLQDAYQQLEKKNVELQNAHELLEARARDLEVGSMYKSQFLANVSHELRTPLNSIILLSGILCENREKNLTDSDLECAQAIQSSGKALLLLINEVLDLSKIEAGKMAVNTSFFETKTFVQAIEREFLPLAKNKGLDFSVRMDADIPLRVQSDSQRLEQVLRNFISNALKFTKQGSVVLRVSRPRKEDALPGYSPSKCAAFSVTDSGIGIPQEKMEEIFEAFTQADGTTSREFGGTGLGLTISREIARLIGGAVRAESEPGAGSTFTLVIPEVYAAPADPPIVRPWEGVGAPGEPEPSPPVKQEPLQLHPENERFFNGRHILLADRDMRHVFTLRKILGDVGAKVIVARNAHEILERLQENENVSLIIAEEALLSSDSYAPIKSIRDEEAGKGIPLVVLSKKQDGPNCQSALEAGANACLAKPVNLNSLASRADLWPKGDNLHIEAL